MVSLRHLKTVNHLADGSLEVAICCRLVDVNSTAQEATPGEGGANQPHPYAPKKGTLSKAKPNPIWENEEWIPAQLHSYVHKERATDPNAPKPTGEEVIPWGENDRKQQHRDKPTRLHGQTHT